MKFYKTILFFILLFCCSLLRAQTIHYVKIVPSGSGNGLSWDNASDDLQSIINIANSGDSVFVAAGTYFGGFTLKEGVKLVGGFTGTEVFSTQRKFPGTGENLTILDGKGHQTVITQPADFSTRTVLSGFVIQNGASSDGGGAYLRRNGVLSCCIVRNNKGGEPQVGDYILTQGGVVFHIDYDKDLAYAIALDNHGQNFQMDKGSLTATTELSDAQMDMDGAKNTSKIPNARAVSALKEYVADTPADALTDWYIPSAGEWNLFVSNGDSIGVRSKVAEKVDATLNKLGKTPLGLDSYWSSTASSTNGLGEMWYVDFKTNSLGTIHSLQYKKIRGARTFSLKQYSGHGGGVYMTQGASIDNCLLYNNSAPEGSAIYMADYCNIYSSTIVSNSESTGASATNYQAVVLSADATASANMYNVILWGNRNNNNDITNYSGNISLKYCALEADGSTIDKANGNIAVNSDNANVAGPNFVSIGTYNYHITAESPCASAGNRSLMNSRFHKYNIDGDKFPDLTISIGMSEPVITTGFEKLTSDSQFQYTPKLVKAGESITISADGLSFIRWIDLTGNVLFSTTANGNEAVVKVPLEVGTYLLSVQTKNGGTKTLKILVIR